MGSRTPGGRAREFLPSTAAVAFGVGVAAVAGFAAGAAIGAGMLTASAVTRKAAKEPCQLIRRDEHGRVQNWPQALKAVQQGVSGAGVVVRAPCRPAKRPPRPPPPPQTKLPSRAADIQGVTAELRAELWPLLLGVFPPASSEAEREVELERLRRLYTKAVLVCQELHDQLEHAKARDLEVPADAGAPGPAACSSDPGLGTSSAAEHLAGSPGQPLAHGSPPPRNLSAFAEAHRIIVMDAVRTDVRQQPAAARASSSAGPTITVLPVATCDGGPADAMLVSMAAPAAGAGLHGVDDSPAAAVAAGRVPVWQSRLATDVLSTASHVDDFGRRQMLRLVNVLSAYSVADPETGYCQGM
jgi:hypothetical protein